MQSKGFDERSYFGISASFLLRRLSRCAWCLKFAAAGAASFVSCVSTAVMHCVYLGHAKTCAKDQRRLTSGSKRA